MPLKKGSSEKTMAHNYHELIAAGYSHEQAQAIMLNKAYGPAPKKKGKKDE